MNRNPCAAVRQQIECCSQLQLDESVCRPPDVFIDFWKAANAPLTAPLGYKVTVQDGGFLAAVF